MAGMSTVWLCVGAQLTPWVCVPSVTVDRELKSGDELLLNQATASPAPAPLLAGMLWLCALPVVSIEWLWMPALPEVMVAGSTLWAWDPPLLIVIEWPWPEPPAPHFEELPPEEAATLREFRRSLEGTWQAKLQGLVPQNADGRCRWSTVVRHGKAHRQVLAAAEDCHADLIVMGVHGRDAIDLTVFGSTANQVVRRAPCPVLTVRQQARARVSS